ncbi:MAG: hypothetical protein Q8M40_10720 [Legionella sp.]|nr:hypothetical protein [Legionella sp.]
MKTIILDFSERSVVNVIETIKHYENKPIKIQIKLRGINKLSDLDLTSVFKTIIDSRITHLDLSNDTLDNHLQTRSTTYLKELFYSLKDSNLEYLSLKSNHFLQKSALELNEIFSQIKATEIRVLDISDIYMHPETIDDPDLLSHLKNSSIKFKTIFSTLMGSDITDLICQSNQLIIPLIKPILNALGNANETDLKSKITYLDLKNNQLNIKSFNDISDILAYLENSSVVQLDLSSNDLFLHPTESIESREVTCSRMTHLLLEGKNNYALKTPSEISSLIKGFKNTGITSLNLSNNRLYGFIPDIIEALKESQITHLNLSKNYMYTKYQPQVNQKIFEGLEHTSITHLDLDNMIYEETDLFHLPTILKGLHKSSVTHLSLQNNWLNQMSRELFNHLFTSVEGSTVSHIDLRGNSFNTLSAESLEVFLSIPDNIRSITLTLSEVQKMKVKSLQMIKLRFPHAAHLVLVDDDGIILDIQNKEHLNIYRDLGFNIHCEKPLVKPVVFTKVEDSRDSSALISGSLFNASHLKNDKGSNEIKPDWQSKFRQ